MTKSVKIVLTALISIGWISNCIWLALSVIYTPFIFLALSNFDMRQFNSELILIMIFKIVELIVCFIAIIYPPLFIRTSGKPRSKEADILLTITVFAPLFLIAAYNMVETEIIFKKIKLIPIIAYSQYLIANIILRQSWKNE